MNSIVKQHLTDIEIALQHRDLSVKQHFKICNKLNSIEEFIRDM